MPQEALKGALGSGKTADRSEKGKQQIEANKVDTEEEAVFVCF